MIESPVLDELIAEMTAKRMHRAILGVLDKRFGPVPSDLSAILAGIANDERLQQINGLAALCSTLDEFRQKLGS